MTLTTLIPPSLRQRSAQVRNTSIAHFICALTRKQTSVAGQRYARNASLLAGSRTQHPLKGVICAPTLGREKKQQANGSRLPALFFSHSTMAKKIAQSQTRKEN
jgi:hypothetical protein